MGNGCEVVNIGGSTIEDYLKLLLLLYAVDTIIMSTSKQGLQVSLNYLCDYCKKLKLEINSGKTRATVFGHRERVNTKLQCLCNGERLEIVHCLNT